MKHKAYLPHCYWPSYWMGDTWVCSYSSHPCMDLQKHFRSHLKMPLWSQSNQSLQALEDHYSYHESRSAVASQVNELVEHDIWSPLHEWCAKLCFMQNQKFNTDWYSLTMPLNHIGKHTISKLIIYNIRTELIITRFGLIICDGRGCIGGNRLQE